MGGPLRNPVYTSRRNGATRASRDGTKQMGTTPIPRVQDRKDREHHRIKKPQAYQNRPDARPAESDAGMAAATHGLHVRLWNCQSYFWHSTEQ